MDDDKKFHEEILELLDATNVSYEVDERLTTDNDYYNRTIFKIIDSK